MESNSSLPAPVSEQPRKSASMLLMILSNAVTMFSTSLTLNFTTIDSLGLLSITCVI